MYEEVPNQDTCLFAQVASLVRTSDLRSTARLAIFSSGRSAGYTDFVAGNRKDNMEPRINNRRATHDYFIEAKIECGIVLVGSEVKSLRMGKASLQEAFARVEGNRLILYQCHIDPYEKAASVNNHEPLRSRTLLVHKTELKRLVDATSNRGTTLIPVAIYFKDGRAKVELGVARGKQQHDKRESIKRKEQDRELRRMQMQRR
jgi:SsrA-binding protein